MSSPDFAQLDLAEQQRIDAVCLEFEDRWLEGPHPDLSAMLQRVPQTLQPMLLIELVKIDLAYRRRRGEPARVESYLRTWEQYRDTLQDALGSPESKQDPPIGALQPGEIVRRYRIIERIGAGGFGEVYLARDEDLSRDVALKTIHGGSGDHELLL